MPSPSAITIFMCGDVMTGRGIDQILPWPSVPHIFESYVRDARGYVELAEDASGPLPKPAGFSYVWGDALDVLTRLVPDVRLINLETAVTESEEYWPHKGINYRMHPRNVPAITAAGIDVCALANNHVLDWGFTGLAETLATLKGAGIGTAGAGRNLDEAAAPAIVTVEGKGRVLVFACGDESSGIPAEWEATAAAPGVHFLRDLGDETVRAFAKQVRDVKEPGDIVIASIHWGGNWGYGIPREQTDFAHRLIDEAGVDIIHGHSSHHAKGIEVYRGKPVIYGCGDFINDYEGISGNERYRGELGLMYFVQMEPVSGKLAGLRMQPTVMKRFRVDGASQADALWLCDMLNREGRSFGTGVAMENDGTLVLQWR
jgi:poly-gamma-glutamate capsule biosynthesis protein CapA/YwtB (metallophosphatase superfamily)